MDTWIDFLSSAPFDRTWLFAAVALLAFGVLLLLASLVALLRLHPLSFLLRIVFGAVLFALGVVVATVAVGTAGYQALTREQTAATVRVEPAGPQRFNATVRLVDGRTQAFTLAGDEIYIDAHILKWQPIANMSTSVGLAGDGTLWQPTKAAAIAASKATMPSLVMAPPYSCPRSMPIYEQHRFGHTMKVIL